MYPPADSSFFTDQTIPTTKSTAPSVQLQLSSPLSWAQQWKHLMQPCISTRRTPRSTGKTLIDLGHPQYSTLITYDNSTASRQLGQPYIKGKAQQSCRHALSLDSGQNSTRRLKNSVATRKAQLSRLPQQGSSSPSFPHNAQILHPIPARGHNSISSQKGVLIVLYIHSFVSIHTILYLFQRLNLTLHFPIQ